LISKHWLFEKINENFVVETLGLLAAEEREEGKAPSGFSSYTEANQIDLDQ